MKIRTVVDKFWLFGPVSGIACAVLTTALFTAMDWARNSGGIFRDSSGTDWSIVYDTAASWFVPTLVYVTILAGLGHLVAGGLVSVYRKQISKTDGESGSQ